MAAYLMMILISHVDAQRYEWQVQRMSLALKFKCCERSKVAICRRAVWIFFGAKPNFKSNPILLNKKSMISPSHQAWRVQNAKVHHLWLIFTENPVIAAEWKCPTWSCSFILLMAQQQHSGGHVQKHAITTGAHSKMDREISSRQST